MCPKPMILPCLSPVLASTSVQVRAKVAAVVLAKLAMAVHTAASEEQGAMPAGDPEDSSWKHVVKYIG